MTDQELIERIEQAEPEEWTRAELRLLRQRIRNSDQVRDALADRLHIEHQLGDQLGSARLPVDQLLARLDQQVALRRRSVSFGLGFGLALTVLLLVVGAALWQTYGDTLLGRDLAEAETVDPAATGEDPGDEEAPANPGDTGQAEASDEEGTAASEQNPNPEQDDPADSNPAQPSADAPPNPAQPPQQPADMPDQPQQNPPPEQPDQAAAEPEPAMPWDEMLASQPIPWVDFPWNRAGRSRDQVTFRADGLSQWLTKAADNQHGLVESRQFRGYSTAGFKGLVRFLPSWPSGAALRAIIPESRNLHFHFLHGETGLTVVRYNRDYNPWYCYVTTLKEGESIPTDYRLTASDLHRDIRSESRDVPTHAFYYDEAAKQIVVYRGEVEVARGPLPGPPDQILWQGEAVVDHLEFVPIESFPQGPADLSLVADITRPADLPWEGKLHEHVEIKEGDQGELVFTSEKAQDTAWIATPIPGHGPRVVELEIEGIDKAFGLTLTTSRPASEEDEEDDHRIDQPRDGIVFTPNRHTEGWQVRFSNAFDTGGEIRNNLQDHPTTEARDKAWVRILGSSGQLRGWVSVDGEHWAGMANEINNASGEFTHLAIAMGKTDQSHELKVHRIRVRKFEALHGLTTEQELAKAFSLPPEELPEKVGDLLEDPQQDLSPAEVAILLRRLTNADAKVDEIHQFGQWAMRQDLPLGTRRQMLRELAIYGRSWPGGGHEKQFLDWLRELPHQWLRETESLADYDFPDYRHDLFNLPDAHRDHATLTDRDALRDYLIRAIHELEGERVLRACERVRAYYHFDPQRLDREHPVVGWAGSMASRLVDRPVIDRFYVSDQRWRWLLVEELSKEAYNISAELNAALEGEAYEDACKVITRIPTEAAFGLSPSAHDPRHLYSLPAAISMAIQNHQPLRAAMRDGFSEIAMLRANQAITEGNTEAAELVTLQFLGTEGATRAHVWLGDQAIAAGQFTQAMGHYHQAERSALGPQNAALRARLRMLGAAELAANEMGSDAVRLGDHQEAPKSFTESTRQIRGLRPGDRAELRSDEAAGAEQMVSVEPGKAFERVGDPLELDWGHNPHQNFAEYNRREIDWRTRHLAVTQVGNSLITSTRFQLACWDLAENRLRWKSPTIDHNRGETHRWRLQEMTPASNGQSVFARMLTNDGPILIAYDIESGEKQWELIPARTEVIASDPFLVHGDLMCFTLKEDAQEHYVAQLTRIDPELGEATWDHELFRIHKSWDERQICSVSRDGEILLANFGGVLAACDVSGQLRWIRKQVTYPKDTDESWVTQPSLPPLIHQGLCYTYHGGSVAVECIEVETGKLRWSKFEPDLTQMAIHPQAGLLLLAGKNRLTAVDPQTASEVWTTEHSRHIRQLVVLPESVLLLAHVPGEEQEEPYQAVARWVDMANGQIIGDSLLDETVDLPSDKRLELGPVVVVDGGVYTLVQPNDQNAHPQWIAARP